ncbi:MAG: hypothetical protein WCO25_04160 [Candidatus Uhrbacteria bacterium]
MLTSLMLVGASPGIHPKFLYHDGLPSSPDAMERIAEMRPIDVDLEISRDAGIDVVGEPIWCITDGVLSAFDRAVDRCEQSDGERKVEHVSLSDDSDDDEAFDFGPMRAHDATDESSRELRLHADDPNEMHLGIFGGCSSTVKYAELERMRIREPIETISFHL